MKKTWEERAEELLDEDDWERVERWARKDRQRRNSFVWNFIGTAIVTILASFAFMLFLAFLVSIIQ